MALLTCYLSLPSVGRLKGEPAVARGQAATDLSKVTPGKAGSTSVALTHPGAHWPPRWLRLLAGRP